MLSAPVAKTKFLTGVVAMKKILTTATVAFLAGCVSIPTVQNFGSGRFLQMNARGSTFFQMDAISPESCTAEAAKAVRQPGLDIVCSTVSQEKSLPYSFGMKNVLTSETTFVRSQTLDGCKLMMTEFEKQEHSGHFKFSECK